VTGPAPPWERPWRVLAEEQLLETDRMRVTREAVELQDGRIVDDYFQIHMGAASVIAARDEDGRFLLMRMYKHGPRRTGLGFPGGGVEAGEDALGAARRELLEETGYEAAEWRELGAYTVHSNQGCGFVSFFLAMGARRSGGSVEGDLELHEFVLLTREEVRQALAENAFLSMGHACMAALLLSLA
jgi:ADP-ribose pyrophosphatase